MSIIASAAGRVQRTLAQAARGARDIVASAALAAGVRPSRLIRHDLLPRPHYALGLVLASAEAVRLGLKGITVVELGVGAGGGLLNLCKLCGVLRREFALDYRIVGFDTGQGLPPPADYRDHPEIWRAAQYVHDRDALRKAMTPNARVEYGDVKVTAPAFIAAAKADCPVGFVAVDLDYYSSTRDALAGLMTGPADRYLPAVVMYADDVEYQITYNAHCGEMLAMNEFSAASATRKIEPKRVRVLHRPRRWHHQIYCCHVLDHPARNQVGENRLGDANELHVWQF